MLKFTKSEIKKMQEKSAEIAHTEKSEDKDDGVYLKKTRGNG